MPLPLSLGLASPPGEKTEGAVLILLAQLAHKRRVPLLCARPPQQLRENLNQQGVYCASHSPTTMAPLHPGSDMHAAVPSCLGCIMPPIQV